MNNMKLMAICMAGVSALCVQAQSAATQLSIHVESVPGDDLKGQTVSVTQTEWSVGYGTLTLDAQGNCSVKVYEGRHELAVDRPGFVPLRYEFTVEEGATAKDVSVTLEEKTRTPFALTAVTEHDAYTGKDMLTLTWNTEPPAFFDDFEAYDPFAVSFGDWTGIDGDNEAAAALLGSYPNRGVNQYAQIINPLTVIPTWWYDYPILRPYSGKQYAGFVRTASGNANDDWLISPVIRPGNDNILSFMAKAADQYDERFMVYVTEKTDNPKPEDFVRLDAGNFETVDYRGWRNFTYDLSKYAGKEIKFAIRYISDYNRFRSFMLMLDDVYVGQRHATAKDNMTVKSVRSAANPNETFRIFLDGAKIGETDGYSMLIPEISAGAHTLGVQAVYRASESEMSELNVNVEQGSYAKVSFDVKADSKLEADRVRITLLDMASAETYILDTTEGAADIPSLPCGSYGVYIDEGAYEAYEGTEDITADTAVEIMLADNVIDPYNITADTDDAGNVTLSWNRELGFVDSFEEYEDFATGEFGGWRTVDRDQLPVYPIGLGSTSNIVGFPGSGTATNPAAVAPMVFNPWKTEPAMLPTDAAIAAPDGDKSVIFFSPQMARADKWLISPLFEIRDRYKVSFLAKAYSPVYPESMEILVSEGGDRPEDFTTLAGIDELVSHSWGEYSVDLSDYAGKTLRFAMRYTSYDAFLAQIDSFTVAPAEGEGESVDYGNVVRYEIYLDGVKAGEAETPEFRLSGVAPGSHTVGVCSVYKSKRSATTEYTFGVSGVDDICADSATAPGYDLMGRPAAADAKGIIISGGKKGLRN